MANRPQPSFPEPDTKPYWDGVKEGELRYQTCNDCKAVIFYPTAHCQKCGSGSTTWNVSKGEGTVYTFSVVMQNRIPGFQELGAYAVAYVDLDEGPHLVRRQGIGHGQHQRHRLREDQPSGADLDRIGLRDHPIGQYQT